MTTTDLPPIRLMALTLTGRCNFACRYCYASGEEAEDMTEETMERALALIRDGDPRFILQFTGGEPLLQFPLIRKAVAIVEKRRLPAQMQIQTNGSLLTGDIARWLYDHHVGIGLSLDGRPEVNDRQRRTKDGKGTARAISRGFAALREEGIACGITCTVTEDNVDAIDTIADMAAFYGNVRQVGFDILRSQGRGAAMKAPSGKAMKRALSRTAARMKELERVTGIPVAFTQEERVKHLARGGDYAFPHCYAMHGEAAFIDVKGHIYACSSLMGRPAFSLGTVQDGRDGEKTKAVGKIIEDAMAPCRACPYFTRCGGGCFSRWLTAEGKVETSGAECAMKQFFIERCEEHQPV